MKKKYLRALAKAAAVRAIKTVAQTAIATIGSAAVLGAVDWRIVVSASALAGLLVQGVHRRPKRQVKNPHAGPSAIRLRGLLSFLFPILSHSVPCGKT